MCPSKENIIDISEPYQKLKLLRIKEIYIYHPQRNRHLQLFIIIIIIIITLFQVDEIELMPNNI